MSIWSMTECYGRRKGQALLQQNNFDPRKWDYWTKDAAAWCDNQSELSDLWVWEPGQHL